MKLDQFHHSLKLNVPPESLVPALKGLWYDKKGDWEKAHEMIQNESDPDSAWVHAYLHRKEGDLFNADYWYRRAGKKRPSTDLHEEWEQLVSTFME